MKKTFIIFFVLISFSTNSYLFGQDISVPGYIMENDFGKITYIFTNNETENMIFFNGMIKLFEDGNLFFFDFNNLSEQKQELIDIFIIIYEQFFYEWENNPEKFTLIADVNEDQITDHQVCVLSINAFYVLTESGLVDHLHFVLITTSYGDEVLFCNIEG